MASTHDGTVLAGRYDDEAGLFYIDIGRLLAYSEGKADGISESEEREDEDKSHDGQAAGALQVNVVRSAVEPLKRKSQSKRGAVIPKWLQGSSCIIDWDILQLGQWRWQCLNMPGWEYIQTSQQQ